MRTEPYEEVMSTPSRPAQPSFEDWIAKVASEVASDVDPEAYRVYYDQGFTPADAVLTDRLVDDGELPAQSALNDYHERDWQGVKAFLEESTDGAQALLAYERRDWETVKDFLEAKVAEEQEEIRSTYAAGDGDDPSP